MFIQTLTNSARNLYAAAANYVSDAQILKKTGQVFASFLALAVVIDPSKQRSLTRLTNVILSINLIDGFRFLKLPQTLILPVTAESINEFAVAEVVSHALLALAYPGTAKDKIPPEDSGAIEAFAKKVVKEHLEVMSKHEEDACRTVEQFLERLLTRLKKKGKGEIPNNLNINDLMLRDLQNSANALGLRNSLLRSARLLDKVLAVLWTAVDIGSVFCYLKDWNLLDTAKLAMQIGRCSVLSFIKDLNLELVVLGSVCVGYILDVIESIRKLHDETLSLSPQERRHAILNIIGSSFEAVLFAGMTINAKLGGMFINPLFIHGFAIISRLVGIVVTLVRINYGHEFFQSPRPQTPVPAVIPTTTAVKNPALVTT